MHRAYYQERKEQESVGIDTIMGIFRRYFHTGKYSVLYVVTHSLICGYV